MAKRFVRWTLDFFEVYLPVAIFLILISATTIEVIWRYVLHHSLPWAFELSTYSFVWVIFLGAGLARRYRRHIRCDILFRKLPRRAQIISEIVFDTLTNAILLIVFIPSLRYAFWCYPIKASALRIPWTYLLIVYPIFIVLLFIHNSFWIYSFIRELLGKETTVCEVPPWE
ncbi:MAG: TRAP transporter small permease [bacterium]